MVLKVNNRTFSGAAGVFDGTLSSALAALAVNEAKRCLDADNPTALTDNSGGAAADGTIGAITAPAAFTETGTASAQKAEFETALGLVKDAFTELGTKLEECFVAVPAITFVDSSGGAAADDTIAALDVSMTAVNTSIAAYAGTALIAQDYIDTVASLAAATNVLCVAVGVTPLTDNSGGDVQWNADVAGAITIPALTTSTGTAVSGAALSGISKAGADAYLAALAAAVKEIATKINACITAAAAPTVAALVKVAD